MKCGFPSYSLSPWKPLSSASAISSWDALTTRITIEMERVRKSAHVNTDLAAHFVMEEIRAMANQFWSAQ